MSKTTKAPRSDAQEPFTPLLVGFYIALDLPLVMPNHYRFTALRGESLDWLTEPAERFTFLRRELIEQLIAEGQSNFVAFVLWRWPRTINYPFDQMNAAKNVAKAVLGHEDGSTPEGLTFGKVPPPPDVETHGVVIEAVTGLIDHESGDPERAVDDAFGRCLEELSVFLQAYAQTTGDLQVRPVTAATVPPFVPAVLGDPFTHRATSILFSVNLADKLVSAPPPDLTRERVEEVMGRWGLAKQGQSLFTFHSWGLAALRAYRLDGDYPAAVIACHTAGEVFFDALLLMMAWEEMTYFRGSMITRERTVEWFTKRASLESRLRQYYHGRLHGGWNPAQVGTPLHQWVTDVGRLRNRTVHAGYQPTEYEAGAALAALDEAQEYVANLLVDDRNRNRYPRTAYMMLGRSGLEDRDAFKGEIKRLVEISSREWLKSFGAYRSWVDAQLNAV